jgi:hypothetical protein
VRRSLDELVTHIESGLAHGVTEASDAVKEEERSP